MKNSIGIIGGSDGPTEIIVSANPLIAALVLAGIAILTAAVIIYILKRKKK